MGNILDKQSVLDRIKQFYGLKGNAELARFLGVAPNTITNWYGRNTFDIDTVYTNCVDLNFDWLFTGRGSMLRSDQTQPVPQPAAQSTVQDSSSGEAAIYYKMYKEEKEGKEALIAENATLKERLRQQETPPVKEPAHPPLIEKLVDAFTPDSLGGSGKDFMRTRNPVPSKTSSASKI